MRLLSESKPKATAGAAESGPSEEVLWDKLRAGKFVLFYIKGDPRSYVRCADGTQVDAENRGFTVWYNIHRVPSKKGQAHGFERPLTIIRFTLGFRNKRGGSGWVAMAEQERKGHTRCTEPWEKHEVELIATGFNMEHGGKVPKPVQQRRDDWLRRSAEVDERSLVAISEPRESELKKIERQLMQR